MLRIAQFIVVCGVVSAACGGDDDDSGAIDAAVIDGGAIDGPAVDAARPDARPPDGGRVDAASVDGAPVDAGTVDGGTVDSAAPDAIACPTTPCDPVEQCGCTASTACDIDPAMPLSTACRSVSTPGMESSACATATECAGGYVCTRGACRRYCGEDADCGDPRRHCVIPPEVGGVESPDFITCSSACDPTDAAAGGLCPTDFSCHLSFVDPDGDPESGDETAFGTCAAAGSGLQGDPCAIASDCALDHLCVNAGVSICTRMCTFNPLGDECVGVTKCVFLIPTMLIGGIEYGVCI